MFCKKLNIGKLYIVSLIATLTTIITSCGENISYKQAESGLLYKIIDNNRNTGKQAKIGDILELSYSYEVENGKVLYNSIESGRSYLKRLEKPAHKGGSIEDGLLMLHEGDSAIFKISAENFLLFSEKYSKLPQGVKNEDNIIIKVRLIDIMDKDEMDSYVSASYHRSREQEEQILQKYLQNANIQQDTTPSGLYVIIKNNGEGDLIKKGNLVSLNYTLTLIDGKLIETTQGRQPMKFVYGSDRMIAGWEEAMPMLRKGSSCQLIVPSKLAYSDEGKGEILPYSTLIFDIEIIDIQ